MEYGTDALFTGLAVGGICYLSEEKGDRTARVWQTWDPESQSYVGGTAVNVSLMNGVIAGSSELIMRTMVDGVAELVNADPEGVVVQVLPSVLTATVATALPPIVAATVPRLGQKYGKYVAEERGYVRQFGTVFMGSLIGQRVSGIVADQMN